MESMNKASGLFELLDLIKSGEDAYNILDSIKDNNMLNNIEIYGDTIKSEDSNILNIENETGVGRIKIYNVFNGIQLIYNDMHFEYCNRKQKGLRNCIEINHCKEGTYECYFGEKNYCYISPGDLAIDSLNKKKTYSSFRLSHYHGITIIIDFDKISKELRCVMKFLSIDLEGIKIKFCDSNNYFIMRANESIKSIFSELYYLKEKSSDGYMKIKVLELLIFLTSLNNEETINSKKYYSKNQEDIANNIKKIITEDITKHHTITELSDLLKVSASTLKNSFKDVYGSSIYSYLKSYRLTTSQKMLFESNDTITKIAEDIGYENPNKFTSAFKKEFGISPSEYRKVILLDRKKFNRSGGKNLES